MKIIKIEPKPLTVAQLDKVAYLTSNPELIETYGEDTATAFINTLRDKDLDAATRSNRLEKLNKTLESLILDLNNVLDTKPDIAVKSLVITRHNELHTLLTMSKEVVVMGAIEDSSSELETITKALDPKKCYLAVARDITGYVDNDRHGRPEDGYLELITFNAKQNANVELLANTASQAFFITFVSMCWVLGGMNATFIWVALAAFIFMMGKHIWRYNHEKITPPRDALIPKNHRYNHTLATIDIAKLNTFIETYSRFSIEQMRNALQLFEVQNRGMVNISEDMYSFLLNSADIFDAYSEFEIEYAGENNENLFTVLTDMGTKFDAIIMKNDNRLQPLAIEQIKDKSDDILTQLEESKQIKILKNKQESAIFKYMNDNKLQPHRGE